MSEPIARLPARPSLEQLRKQAKRLLRDARSGDAIALHRMRAQHPRSSKDATEAFTLAAAQHTIAREYGFESWPRLVHHIESSKGLAKYDQLATEVARAYIDGDGMAIRNINWTHGTSFVWDHEPERMRQRLTSWYASATRAAELALSDARHLVAKQAGADSWDELGRMLTRSTPRSRGLHPLSAPFYRVDERERTIEVRGPLSEDNWDVIVDVMKELQLTGLRAGGQITDRALERLSHVDHVTRLDLSFLQHASAAGLRHLARLPLEHLDLGGWRTQVDDDALEVLRDLHRLRYFSAVWAQRVTDRGLAHLAGCARLETVNLMGTASGDGALRALGGKERLSQLDAGTRVTPAGLALLHDFPVFTQPLPEFVLQHARTADLEPTYVQLHPAPFVRGGMEALAGLTGLYSLRLFSVDRSIPPVTGAALRPAAALPLASLWCDPVDDAMGVIAAMPRLRKLMCQDTAAGDAGWIALGRSQTIESIWGRRNPNLTGSGFRALAQLPALRTLGVNLARVDNDSLALLSTNAGLRELTPIGLADAAFHHVGACTSLETLTCMYTDDITDDATSHITRLHRLKKYYAGDTRITDQSLELLAALPALEDVELWSCTAITNDGLAALARAPHLRRVQVEGSPRVTRDALQLFPGHATVSIAG